MKTDLENKLEKISDAGKFIGEAFPEAKHIKIWTSRSEKTGEAETQCSIVPYDNAFIDLIKRRLTVDVREVRFFSAKWIEFSLNETRFTVFYIY